MAQQWWAEKIVNPESNFFEEKKWKKNENENVWETKNKVFKRKIFKIENFEDNILRIKIIVENF
mgnify:CR=1 FL=1